MARLLRRNADRIGLLCFGVPLKGMLALAIPCNIVMVADLSSFAIIGAKAIKRQYRNYPGGLPRMGNRLRPHTKAVRFRSNSNRNVQGPRGVYCQCVITLARDASPRRQVWLALLLPSGWTKTRAVNRARVASDRAWPIGRGSSVRVRGAGYSAGAESVSANS